MKKAVIIGAGQLGSRHLQGLLRCKTKQEIVVYDLSINSLNISKNRALEINNDHNLTFTNNWEDIPIKIDLAIISTNSNVRYELLEKLLKNSAIKNIVLEKVLFQSILEYKLTENLQERYPETNLWVNHPRRMSTFYNQLKNRLNNNDDKIINISISGNNWGLACNSLHFIDLSTFLINSDLKTLNTSYLEKTIKDSKRIGFFEFNGTLFGEFENKTFITLYSNSYSDFNDATRKIYINIITKFEQIFICEDINSSVVTFGKDLEIQNLNFLKFELKLQSALTTEIADEIYVNNSCQLPTFKESLINHKVFINALLQFYNELNSCNVSKLPIT